MTDYRPTTGSLHGSAASGFSADSSGDVETHRLGGEVDPSSGSTSMEGLRSFGLAGRSPVPGRNSEAVVV